MQIVREFVRVSMGLRIGFAMAALFLASVVVADPADAEDAAAGTDVDAELDRLFAETWDAYLELDPTLAHRIGDRRLRNRLTVGLDPERMVRERALFDGALVRLDALEVSAADPRRRLWAAAFRRMSEMALERHGTIAVHLPLKPGYGQQVHLAQVAAGTVDLDFDEAADFLAYAGRLGDFERWVEQVIRSLEEGRRRGITHPRVVVERMLGELDGHLPDVRAYRRPLAQVRGLPRAEGKEAEATTLRAVEENLRPSLERLRGYLAETYLPSARESLSLSDVPGGEKLYGHLVRHYTSTDLSPEEIYALGEKEVARVKREIVRRGRVAAPRPSGSPMRRFERIEEHVRERLPELFLRVPDTPFEIRRVPPFRAAVTAGAFYERGVEGRRPGIFYVNLDRLDPRTAEVLFLHEALPGHHLQIAFAQEADDLPGFLRHGHVGAYVEGWGLYAESLGDELGLYADPAQDLGRLSYQLGRASRLVADVGIHHLGWSHQEARRRLEGEKLFWAAREIVRYATLPAQALSYEVGEERIQALRRRAEDALGDDFDLARFHHAVLADGPLPLDVLEKKIEALIEADPAESTLREASGGGGSG